MHAIYVRAWRTDNRGQAIEDTTYVDDATANRFLTPRYQAELRWRMPLQLKLCESVDKKE